MTCVNCNRRGVTIKTTIGFQLPANQAELEAVFGKFAFHHLTEPLGSIEIDAPWPAKNIVAIHHPILPRQVEIHRFIAGPFRDAISRIAYACPDYKIVTCTGFVPRHKMHDPAKGLSLHSWGAAFDLNPSTNKYGQRDHDLPETLIKIFEERGFEWGGRWSTPDPMHFQAAKGGA